MALICQYTIDNIYYKAFLLSNISKVFKIYFNIFYNYIYFLILFKLGRIIIRIYIHIF